ncbi:MAG TPA: YaiO family outer membrane beta-barrel protein [Sphingobium sp.]|nr:YaiO family outer membrane beta-barrel protein [Sphingobium sp.]
MILAFCAVALAAAAPAAEQPTPRAQQVEQARAALARQDPRAAIRLLEQAGRDFPDDAEILRLLGSAYAFDRRYPEAITTLQRASARAPADMDIRLALARAYLWSGNRQAAADEIAAIEQRSPNDADAAAIRRQLQAPAKEEVEKPAAFGVALAQSLSHVSFPGRSGRTWSTTSFAAFGGLAPGTTLSLEADREDRQTAIDTRVEARLDQRVSSRVRAFVAFAATPHADFRERWGVSGGVEADIAPFATLIADLRHAEYRDASVTVFQPGLRLSARRMGLDATVRMINLWDEVGTHRTGISGRIDQSLAGGATLYAGAATYPDTEAGVTRQMHSLFAGGTVPISSHVLLRAGLDYDRRSTSYRRKGASLGLQVRF